MLILLVSQRNENKLNGLFEYKYTKLFIKLHGNVTEIEVTSFTFLTCYCIEKRIKVLY